MSYCKSDWVEDDINAEMEKIPHGFLSVRQAADVLQVNPLTIKRWIWCVELPAWNTKTDGKGHWRVAKESVTVFVQKRNSMNIDFKGE